MEKQIKIGDDFETFINNDWSEYSGKWIAICGTKIIANKDLNKVMKESAKICGNNVPTFTKIPKKNTALLL